jgi:hypothetical protein
VFVVVIITILLAASHRVMMVTLVRLVVFVLMLGLFVNGMPLEADLGWATWAII